MTEKEIILAEKHKRTLECFKWIDAHRDVVNIKYEPEEVDNGNR